MIGTETYTGNIWQEQSGRTAGSMPGESRRPSKAAASEAESFNALVKSASTGNGTKIEKTSAAHSSSKEEGGFFSFIKTVLDIINPLQHIPVINTIYRQVTGDEISPIARLAGDTLYGGPVGAAVALADIAIEKKTGKDIGETAMAFFNKKEKAPEASATMLASAKYNDIQPSSGGSDQIIWNTPAVVASIDQNKFSSSPTVAPTKPGLGMNEKGPAAPPPSHAEPVPPQKNGMSPLSRDEIAARGEAGTENALRKKDAPAVLPLQDAPAAFLDRMSGPPELLASGEDKDLIANKMMEALDKYTALKKSEFSNPRTF
jgi:hypothetical protein